MTEIGTQTEETRSEKGFFYIMTNPAQLGLVLIGTSARHPEERLLDNDLNGAGVPLPYEIRYYALVSDMKAALDHVHSRLASAHVDKQFYETTTGMAVDAIEGASVEILFRETDVSVHEISSAGRRPEPARLSRGQYRPQTPYATSLGEQRKRKQQALNRMVGDTPEGENIVPPSQPAPPKALPAAAPSNEAAIAPPRADAPAMRTEPTLITVGTAPSGHARAFDRNAVRELESQSNLNVAPVKEEVENPFFEPEPESAPVPAKPTISITPPGVTSKSAHVHELRKAPPPENVAIEPQAPRPQRIQPSIDELVEKQISEESATEQPKNAVSKKKNARKPKKKAATKNGQPPAPQVAKEVPQPVGEKPVPQQPTATKADLPVAPRPEPKANVKPGSTMPIPSLSKAPAETASGTSAAATSNQPVPQTVAPAGIVYGPQGPVALHPIPGTPYMAVTPVQMAPGQNGAPGQHVVQTMQTSGGITTAAPTGIATMANGAMNPAIPQPAGALPAPGAHPDMSAAHVPGLPAPAGMPAPGGGAMPNDPAQLQAWLSEQDNAANRKSKNRRAILMSLLGIPVGAIGGGAYVVMNEGLNQSQIGAVVGGAVVGGIVLFYLIGRFTGGKKTQEFEPETPDFARDRVDPTLD